jgi:RNA polymerase sigma-70 factor, ECF subfamily
MADRSDHELVKQCLDGDNKAFEILVQRYEMQMYRTAFGIVNDGNLAKDVTQAGFIKSWEKLQTFNPEYKFYSWLYRIIVNEALNRSRNKKKYEALSLYQPDSDTPYTQLLQKEENRMLSESINSLPADYRVVIQLRHFEELSYKEIADTLEIEVSTVKSRLYSARMMLRKKLYDR